MYNCYYHPKTEGSNTCKGCKLPVCAHCEGELGFCPDCMRKRDAVHQLRALRGAVEQKKKIASTTARLRLAIRQMGPGQVRVAAPTPAASPAPARAQMATRPLPALDETFVAPKPQEAPAVHRPARRRGTGTWKYDPDKLAYRAPENLAQINKKRRPARQAKQAYEARPEFQWTAAVVAKVVSLGLAMFVGLLCYQLFFKVAHSTKPAAHPLYTPLSQSERKIVDDTLKQAQPVKKKFVDLPDAMLDSQPRPQPVQEAPVARSGFEQAAAVARTVAPAPVAPAPVYHPAPRPVAYAAPRTAAAAAYVAPRAYYAPRPQRVVYGGAPAATRRQPSLESAMHFSGPGRDNAGHGGASRVEVIHW